MPQQTFNEWLRDQYERTDAIGDLSRSMRVDKKWPARFRESLAPFSDHVRTNPLYGDGVIPVLFNAWGEFQGDLR